VIGQKNNRPANQRRRRLHSANDQVFGYIRKLIPVEFRSASLDEVIDETFLLRFTLLQSKPALHNMQNTGRMITELTRSSAIAEGPRDSLLLEILSTAAELYKQVA